MSDPVNDIATREVLWNISYYYLMYPMLAVCLAIAAVGAWKKWRYVRAGKADDSVGAPWLPRLKRALLDVFLQRRIIKSMIAGLFHVSIFWSFIILLIATTVVAVDMYLPFKIFRGWFYLAISLLADLAGTFFTVGLGIAFVRRYIKKPKNLRSQPQDAYIHGAFFFLMFSGFVLEGMRIHYAGDPWAAWTPFGNLLSMPFHWVGEEAGRWMHRSLWWAHAIVTFSMIAMIPYTKLSHMFTIPTNIALMSNRPRGSLKRPDLEKLMASGADELAIGISTLTDTTWKQRLEHETCIECGRCDNNCPANAAGKQLSPMQIILGQRDLGRQAMQEGLSSKLFLQPLVGDTIKPISLWECRTCYACVEVCPVGIDHLDSIMEMRRSEVLLKGEMPSEAQTMLRTLETRGNPFGSQDDRVSWIEREGFKILKPGEKVEALYWIGCATSFDPRKQKVARDLVRILEKANVNYAVLGAKEVCTGDPARLVGDENIFQTKAKSQLADIDATQFDYMVVNCPHCYNAFDNEYRQFGATFKVVHHTELIDELVNKGRLQLTADTAKKITYHDPCYLGRVQGVYDQPRSLLSAVGGTAPAEPKRHASKSACCGAGGGHFWMDIQEGGERLDNRRVEELAATGANTVGVGCVFCMQMIENGLKAKDLDQKIVVRDVAELVAESLSK